LVGYLPERTEEEEDGEEGVNYHRNLNRISWGCFQHKEYIRVHKKESKYRILKEKETEIIFVSIRKQRMRH
jgi:hypothetical protein